MSSTAASGRGGKKGAGGDVVVSGWSSFGTAASAADVRAVLAGLHEREAALRKKLQAETSGGISSSNSSSSSASERLSRDLVRLDVERATVGAQVVATRTMASSQLGRAATTAGRLSSTVRRLDLEKARVEATLRVAEQVAELRACVAGVVGSMGAPQDWEAAAGYLARASRIPAAIVASGFAAAVVPSVEVPDPPAATLEQARASLCGLFLREFERAAHDGDDARVTRFFKLFPLIGRTDVGLDVYGRYVCQGVAAAARTVMGTEAASATPSPFFYPNALAKLFAHISQIVEAHGALVERHYGPGQMGRVVARLQKEADVQGGIIIDAWGDRCHVDRRLTDAKSYPFSFLVQSFLAQQQRGSTSTTSNGNTGTSLGTSPRIGSPAVADVDGVSPRQSEDEGGVNMKEVDGLLSEIAVMLGRWSLYSRFLAMKSRPPDDTSDFPPLPPVIAQSVLQRKVAARLITPYNLLSTFFFRRSVEKAFQLEEMPAGLTLSMARPLDNTNAPYIISAVDDVMYIVSAVIQKAVSTLQRDVVVGVVPPVGRVLGSDFIGMVQRKMRDEAYPKPAVSGGFPPEDKIIAFVVLINSLDLAVEYLARIVSARMGVTPEEGGPTTAAEGGTTGSAAVAAGGPPPAVPSPTAPAVLAFLRESFSFAHEAAAVAAALAGLHASFATTAAELLGEGLQVLFGQVAKARLRPVLADTFRDADYGLAEADFLELADANDEDVDLLLELVPRRFAHGWDALMRPLARIMTPRTYAGLADQAARYLARVLEKRVWGYVGRASPHGAIRLERDLNGIVAAVARGNYGARELFAKTTQILMVANMDDDEWDELGGGATAADADDDDDIVWLLSDDERRRARNLVKRV
ncbi:cog4-like golgi transport complex subunit protein [Grosmannia clavigera kw1407]|uniref:Conserved oligomeric Golgi complex subunit 4 n=1 Tax=Grosmannia clavigera (strain kw1407 / UAMH 11150) TaxID=655863 RepID=F0XR72_GROCL|nr:cog4-like golgi transport complex subunit protein [Grosmannia clavigera kw1407]EFW99782.1 cog4-like golgi transport complex subunit protein [Grosmannia clavigera kw1407]